MKNKFLSFLISAFLLVVSLVYLFPSLRYQHSYNWDKFEIHTHNAASPTKLKQISQTIKKSLLEKKVIPQKANYHFYLCDNYSEFSCYAIRSGKAFGVTNLLDNHFITISNINDNLVVSNSPIYNTRTLSSVMTHELTHTIIRERVGYFTYYFLDTWKNEGICDYVANETSFPYAEGIALMKAEKMHDSFSFKYFTYFMRVKYLIEEQKMSIDEILEKDIDEEETDKKMLTWVKSSQIGL